MLLSITVHVDTARGTKYGVPNLARMLKQFNIPATFYFSLGPDHTGRALQRIFRPGFFQKVSRTSVVSVYGIRTLLYGILLPGPHIGRKYADIMREIAATDGFEVGIHAYDHQKWQDNVLHWSEDRIAQELQYAQAEFERIFGRPTRSAAAPGWQANEKTLAVYDRLGLAFASDCRGVSPFYPKIGTQTFHTLQIPTTLPTLDELLGQPEFPTLDHLTAHYLQLLSSDLPNVLTIHAELEGMSYLDWFKSLLRQLAQNKVEFMNLSAIAKIQPWPTMPLLSGTVAGRSGKLAVQKIGI